MKKIRNIGLILGLIILISTNGNAQYYYTSYGYAQDWYLPSFVQHTIYDNYYGYEIAHVQRYTRHGYQNFNVLLHRNGWYVELRLDSYGHIYKTVRHRYNYPLMSHNCTGHCGYHKTYYQTYYPKYHHKHNHHNKIVYVNTHHGHNGTYNNNHNTYYTNVHVEKQHKQQKNYNGNNQRNRKTQSNVNHNTTNQQRRTNTVIRKPQQTNKRTVEHKRPQGNGNSKRIQHMNPQRVSSKTSNSNNAKRLMTYKNERGTRNR